MAQFGQVVIGPPGSGKTTYCAAVCEFLRHLGRDAIVVNLDPANDSVPYASSVDLSELVSLSDVMDAMHLGPNGALIYCMEYLEQNLAWLKSKLSAFPGRYVLFDCPGQVELYTHHRSVKRVFESLVDDCDYRLVAVHLVDSHYCNDPSKFISVLLTSLSTMLQISLPQVNVLSKADLIERGGRLSYNLDYFTDVLDLSYILDHLNDHPFFKKFKKLNERLLGVVEDYSLVTFVPLDVQDKQSVLRVTQQIDTANGYVFASDADERDVHKLLSCAVGAEFQYEKIANVQEKYMSSSDSGWPPPEGATSDRQEPMQDNRDEL
ncbi:GPN-loop GTPase 2-like [Tubulanus polymorphus]|uniref:GPN-loop GTPase 2-like n=1 Tax=Tubulanus polymorphus TaxID=672921 RepID=UPI003DA57209